jgi:hypothetical protein
MSLNGDDRHVCTACTGGSSTLGKTGAVGNEGCS